MPLHITQCGADLVVDEGAVDLAADLVEAVEVVDPVAEAADPVEVRVAAQGME